jgi:2-polyprenyl-3-methyl-5-hydroxy-6-metoxy-1,4-benzoquinol methylase
VTDGYAYGSTEQAWDDGYIFQRIAHWVGQVHAERVFEMGCGNGWTLKRLHALGCELAAIEVSVSGAEKARQLCPTARIEVASAYDDLSRFGRFDAVVSIDVIEHLYDVKTFAQRCFELLKPGGIALISTPYHGYLKNLAVAASGKFDAHHNPLWDHGHIKFFSRATLHQLFAEQGFEVKRLERLGRVPVLAKSLLGVFERPR